MAFLDVKWLMEMIHRKAYNFWLKELRRHTSEIHTYGGATRLFKELFDNQFRLAQTKDFMAAIHFVDSYFHSLAFMQQNGESHSIQLFPFIMIDNITTLLGALHLEEGDSVSSWEGSATFVKRARL